MAGFDTLGRQIAMGRRRRGNPSWGKPLELGSLPVSLTEFEKLAASLKLSPQEWPASQKLRAFARKEYKHRWVPEELLKLWGIAISDEEVM